MVDIPKAETLLKEFADRHHMRFGEHIEREILPIRASSIANILVTSGYASLDPDALADPSVGLLLNMLHRNFSLADGAILAFTAECGETAEIAARASLESSVNIAYIASGNAQERMQAYFYHYFSEVDRQVKTWSGGIEGLDQAETEMHRSAVKQRKDANDALRAAIGNTMGTSSERWPRTIDQRFKALGDSLAYRTIYARMSSEVHADAEETLRYFIGKLGTPEQFEAMALETIWTTRLYVHYAVSWFLRASIAYGLRYQMNDAVDLLKREYSAIDTEMAEISKRIGSVI
jgi:hypothetical protein